MNANKVTVEQFLNAGFKFVEGDEFINYVNERYIMFTSAAVCCWNAGGSNDDKWFITSLAPRPNTGIQPVGDDCVVDVTLRDGNTTIDLARFFNWDLLGCSEVECDIITWIPHLPSILEQQMNIDKTALELTERDIEDSLIQQEDASAYRELAESDEWANGRPNVGDEFISNTNQDLPMVCVYSSVYVVIGQIPMHRIPNGEMMDVVFNMFIEIKYEFSKPPTPEQLAAKERLEAAYDIYLAFWSASKNSTVLDSFDEFSDGQNSDLKHFLAVVDKTGYRK